jgi:nucleotide-binding universal stress UspA family protein
MPIRKILVPMEDAESARVVVPVAFAIAERFAAHVVGLHIGIDPTQAVPFVGEAMSGAFVQEMIEITERENAARAAAARQAFERLQAAAGVPPASVPSTGGPSATWMERAWPDNDALVRLGRLSDLIVVGRSRPTGADGEISVMTLSSALFETGRPVLVPGHKEAFAGKRILLAWNGGVEAARAITAALPFFAGAERVLAVSIASDPGGDSKLGDVAEYLAWHGIAIATRFIATRAPVGEALLDAALTDRSDLVVMGGYSHGRLRELILGGVTRYMMERTALPLLVAH